MNELVLEFEAAAQNVADQHSKDLDEMHLGTAFAVMMAKLGLNDGGDMQ